jgi:elongator complex protein 3
MGRPSLSFDALAHQAELAGLIDDIVARGTPSPAEISSLLHRHPRGGTGLFSRAEILQGYRQLRHRYGWRMEDGAFAALLRRRPVRSASGVVPVAVLTHPAPCPAACVFCPDHAGMPKSYLPAEPGAQRAAQQGFDPYRQTLVRLAALDRTGHAVDKVELLVLGGTFSVYPEPYRRWFLARCLAALNACRPGGGPLVLAEAQAAGACSWEDLEAVQAANEGASCRCVGLTVETRPDHLSEEEAALLRRLGVTRVQLGYQSLDDAVLARCRRGHDVAASRRATGLLRRGGFKVLAHWMPNLPGATPAYDRRDFARLFADPALRPDELKIYPCVLVSSPPLVEEWRAGRWAPNAHEELVALLADCLEMTPTYCRLARMVRDIPAHDVMAGTRRNNLREEAERALAARGGRSRNVRAREVRLAPLDTRNLRLAELSYSVAGGREVFIQALAGADTLAGFLRLSLPEAPSFLPELGSAAIVRELHVYGAVAPLHGTDGANVQHRGLGRSLLQRGVELAAAASFTRLAVISAVGTRAYYRALGFTDGLLYQHLGLGRTE